MFPEQDAAGNITGLSTRAADGSKMFVSGGRRGLVVPNGFRDSTGVVLVLEGASDVAACLDMDLVGIGRPSNLGGGEMLSELLAGSQVLIVGENDRRDNGNHPGLTGAVKVAQALANAWGREVRWALPPSPYKDIRSYLQANSEDPTAAGERLMVALTATAETIQAPTKVQDAAQVIQPPIPWRPFPLHALPEPVRSFVVSAAHATNTDPAAVAVHVLPVLGSCIGSSRRLRVIKRRFREFPVIWRVQVARSGKVKSPAFDVAVEPLEEIARDHAHQHAEGLKEFEEADLNYDRELKRWKSEKKSVSSSEPPVKPERPVEERVLCNDTTTEAIGAILSENPRGVLVARDEMSGWLGSFDSYKATCGSDMPRWLEMSRGGCLRIDRKTGRESLLIPCACVSLTGTVQPRTLRRVMTPKFFEAGLVSRILFVHAPERPKVWSERDLPRGIEESYSSLVDKLRSLQPNQDMRGYAVPVEVEFTPSGRERWLAFYGEFAARQNSEGDDDVLASMAKCEGYAARFSLIVHLIRSAVGDRTIENHDEVDGESVNAGAELAWWFSHEQQRVYRIFTESDEQAHVRELLSLVDRRGGAITVRQLQRSNQRQFASSEEAKEALESLVQHGLGEWEHTPGPGQPSAIFRLAGDNTSTHGLESGVLSHVTHVTGNNCGGDQ